MSGKIDAKNEQLDDEQGVAVWRFWFVVSVLSFAVIVLMYRAVELQVVDQQFLKGQGDARTIRHEKIDAHRGMITDRFGEPLAVSTPVETVWANPQEMQYDARGLRELANRLEVSETWLTKRINSNKSREFIYLKRKISPAQAARVTDLDLPGVYSRREYKRFYPAGEVASHVVGFTNIDEMGQEGVELAYDEWLIGHPGKKRVLKNRRGSVIKNLDLVRDAQPGRSLSLSLDMRVQYLAYRELKAAVMAHRAKAGSMVILDVATGEVLAMVNQPSYNPNNRSKLSTSALRNRAITDVFEPGSTVKPVTIAAALETGDYSPGTKIDTTPGYFRVGRKSIRDHRDYGVIDLSTIISKSSNVGTSKIALDLSGEVVWDMFYRLGFGQATGTGFPGESIGLLRNPVKWRPIEVATMSYGYGVSVNALQLAQMYMVLGNNGMKPPVSLIKTEGNIAAEKVMDAVVAKNVRLMLQKVVEKGGTGTRARVATYDVGGKSGTVHSVGRNGYEDSQYKALFAGVAPIDNPRVAAVVVIDGPQGQEYYGGEVAAPIFSRVMSGAMRLLNVTPDNLPLMADQRTLSLDRKQTNSTDNGRVKG
ncbi:peptidoglycan D,D-transpeptidase FtsI family protein [Alkalimarinus alittae]|uniref:Peptidoglycan D,D-transpeptidase FtsI n=1 Tax=Alkalimarinus alittae TaxID=2961619 RepID=A0ABY6N0K0_9ALTE|nr:penicillin-binding transpeptidase domain-containing protein [Alkalimarinus alittae]UZE95565.1 penicillin-binding transpeptidase domain-containing protein [Alkalimarinus alittae]